MIKNLYDIFQISDLYLSFLKDKISFTEKGFPIFERKMLLDSIPEQVVPFYNRNNKIVVDSNKTAICFYASDKSLYPRLEKVFDEINEYKKFAGVIGLDITVTADMDKEWQDAIMLLNQLFLAVLACNGVKIIPNARVGSRDSLKNLNGIPKGSVYATGFLGCNNLKNEFDYSFITKMMHIMPSFLMIYGKHDKIAEEQLDKMGISFRVYPDFHRASKGVA